MSFASTPLPLNLLSVVIPVYNERATIQTVIKRVFSTGYPIEIIIVDDASTDGTWELLQQLAQDEPRLRLFCHAHNRGKGGALQTALRQVRGDVVVIQDADLEYDPADYPIGLEPILRGKADVVYGSRFLSGSHRVLYFWHSVANWLVTHFSNMFTDLNLTDMETGFKMFRREIVEQLTLEQERFGIEPEMTAKIARLQCRIWEVAISYDGRSYEEGKKIGWRDAFEAVGVILWYGLIRRN